MNQNDSQVHGTATGINRQGLAVHHDLTAGRQLHPRQDLHQSRFTGTVLAHNGQYFAGAQLQVHAAQGMHASELFADLLNVNKPRITHAKNSSCRLIGLGANFAPSFLDSLQAQWWVVGKKPHHAANIGVLRDRVLSVLLGFRFVRIVDLGT